MNVLKKDYPREYRIWKAMRARCTAPSLLNTNYQINNIRVCSRWDSFSNFILDMGPCPMNQSIDRIDTLGNYEPNNCRWATMTVQSNNRGAFNKRFTYEGETYTLKEWASRLKIKYTTLYMRLFRSGLSFQEAVITDPFHRKIQLGEISKLAWEWCLEYNIPKANFYDRIRKGWPIEKALTTPIIHR